MIKEEFDPQAIFKMWSTLSVEGWVPDERLPKGWRVRSKDRLKDNWQFYFLSPQMEIFKSNKAVLDYISSQSDTYTQEDFDKVKTWIEDEQRARRGENYTWNEDKSLPDGKGEYFSIFPNIALLTLFYSQAGKCAVLSPTATTSESFSSPLMVTISLAGGKLLKS